MDEMNLEAINLEAVDVDGAIREGAEEVAGDTRISFLRKGAIAGGAALSGGAILSALVPGRRARQQRPPARELRQGRHRDPQLRAHARIPRARLLQRGHRQGRDHRSQDRDLPQGRDARRAQARRVPPEGARQGRPSRSRSSTSTAPPPTRRPSSKPRTCSRTPASTPTSARPGNIKTPAYLLAAASIVTIEARHSGAIGSIINKAINPNGAFDNGLPASAILKAVTGTHFIA